MSNNCCSGNIALRESVNQLRAKVNKNLEKEDSFFGDPCYGDFAIKVRDRMFHVSKHQLALESKVFAAMFKSDIKVVCEGVLELCDDPEAVEAMLKYIYMYKKVEGSELAREVVQLAHRYEISKLKDQCELELIDKLTVSDAIDGILTAVELELSLLFSKCNEYLYHYFKDFDTLDSGETKSVLAAKPQQ
ncbi:unnamed protein product [Bursaphelenchus xylophilus]|nr:unnamed protein product [Bursaphelenchus xylophilus]CAG9080067.1 unnamed protein product [Bursaphelenchus xylophilus]